MKRKDQLELVKLRDKGWTFKRLGKKYKMTRGGVWRIYWLVKNPQDYCNRHHRFYESTCEFCVLEAEYPKVLKNLNQIIVEADKLKVLGKNKKYSIKRKIITKMLKEDYELSFKRIASILNKDVSTVNHYYYAYRKDNR